MRTFEICRAENNTITLLGGIACKYRKHDDQKEN